MTALTLAIRNLLLQDEDLTDLLAMYPTLGPGIFDERPVGARFEGKGKCIIVVAYGGTWTVANEHNTLRFPRIFVDIWADPTRNADKSVQVYDADDKIEVIQNLVDKHLHLVNKSRPDGLPWIWGTAEQMSEKTGVIIDGSSRTMGPDISPISDTDGAMMGRTTYNISHL